MTNSAWPGALDNITPDTDRDAPSLANVLNQLQATLGITGNFNFAKLTDPSLEDVIRQNALNLSAPPAAAVSFGNQRIMNIGTPAASTDAPTALNALLATTYYEPTLSLYSFSSATATQVDTTNLTISFTAISTAVVVELVGAVGYTSGAGLAGWTLLAHSGAAQQGYWAAPINSASGTNTQMGRVLIRVTGLSVGTPYQWDWAAATTGGTLFMGAGCSQAATLTTTMVGPMIMRAFAA